MYANCKSWRPQLTARTTAILAPPIHAAALGNPDGLPAVQKFCIQTHYKSVTASALQNLLHRSALTLTLRLSVGAEQYTARAAPCDRATGGVWYEEKVSFFCRRISGCVASCTGSSADHDLRTSHQRSWHAGRECDCLPRRHEPRDAG